MISGEVQLLTAAVLFYLYESAILIYVNEGLIFPRGNSKWEAKPATRGTFFSGRYLFFLNIFTVHRPIYRLLWRSRELAINETSDWSELRIRYRTFAFVAYSSAILIFVILPAALFFRRSDDVVLIVVALIYTCSVITAIQLLRSTRMGLIAAPISRKLALECVFCPIVTVNIVRRLSLTTIINKDFIATSHQLLGSDAWIECKKSLLTVIDFEIAESEIDKNDENLLYSRAKLLGLEKNVGE